ncbi:hypothetical protein MSAN_00247300 [Mycena sanguinolenta]|uniref:Uncharacterized protein n=1 Tax=Mycena sanguinolenta TaxID=230812 RepID=A0A8H6ZFV7_9AGAR|nr:hypothetical protein MSAN_00247300 [Mycena sanguinolenta]
MAPVHGHTVPIQNLIDDIQTGLYIVMAEVFIYGAYAVMFGFYIYILRTRGFSKNRFLAVATIVLFIVCTVHLALLLVSTALFNESYEATVVGSKTRPPLTAFNLNRATNVVYVTSNIIADTIFIFRCYAIWNFRWKIIVVPALSTLAVAGESTSSRETCAIVNLRARLGLGYFDSGTSLRISSSVFDLSILVSLFTTIMLMGLSAGRIWWLAHKARTMGDRKMTNRYHTICAMILESGALYCAGGITFIILSLNQNISEVVATNGAVLGQLVGVAPTIIAVRVGLGKSIESMDSFATIAQPRAAAVYGHSFEPQIFYLKPEGDSGGMKADFV